MRLIDADALRKPIYAEEDNITGSGMTYAEMDGYNDGIDAAWSRIDYAPTIDAEPVVHGHWVAKKVMARTPFAINHYCSKCKFETDFCTNYCSNCGAKMDEVSDEC